MLKLPNAIRLLAVLLAISLSASAFWAISKQDSTADTATSRMGVSETESDGALPESWLPDRRVEELKRQAKQHLTESAVANHPGAPRFSDGDRQVFQDGPVRVEQIAENCRMTQSGWTCDWRVEFYNPYEKLGESELRGLSDFDPWAGLMLAELMRQEGASESELLDTLVRVVALLPSEDKGRGWMHMMETLGKPSLSSPDKSDAELIEGYAWLLAGIELGILSMNTVMPIEQDLRRRDLSKNAGKEEAVRIAERVRSAFLSSGNNQ